MPTTLLLAHTDLKTQRPHCNACATLGTLQYDLCKRSEVTLHKIYFINYLAENSKSVLQLFYDTYNRIELNVKQVFLTGIYPPFYRATCDAILHQLSFRDIR